MPLIAYTILRNDSSNILRDLVVVYPLTVEKPQSVQLMMLCVRAHVLLLSITHRPISPIHMPYTIDTIYDTTCHLFCTDRGLWMYWLSFFLFSLYTDTLQHGHHMTMSNVSKMGGDGNRNQQMATLCLFTCFYDSLSFALDFFRLQENRVYFNKN